MEQFIAPLAPSEAAPGIQNHDVDAVPRQDSQSISYASRQKVYPKLAHGKFRTIKWIVMAVTLGIYYLLPWIRWDRGPGLPSQAFLLDFAHQRLYFGPIEIWAQEFYYITGLLVIAALGLFLVTSIAGRMWCGYACPQTVWTDLMIAVERYWLGDRNTQLRRDQNPWTFSTLWRKAATHVSWLLIGLLTGGALVFYFRDAPTLAGELMSGTAPAVAYAFLGIFTISTYLLGGIAREQVCIYMCPWPRIQGAMLDQNSLMISYREARGEPRGAHKRGQSWAGRGDCVDCKACVAVCPTGIDIRSGPQLECIQCALCIDACNDIMAKLDRPLGLIDYTTVANLGSATSHAREGWRILRPRTVLYSVLITAISGAMLWSLLNRADLEISVLPDRNPLFVTLSDGSIRNGYTVKIVNKIEAVRKVRLTVSGLPEAQMSIVGFNDANAVIDAVAADLRSLKVYLTLPRLAWSGQTETVPVTFTVTDAGTGLAQTKTSSFKGPLIKEINP